MKDHLKEEISANLHDLAADTLEDHWQSIRLTLHDTTKNTVGFLKRQHRDWFDENNIPITSALKQKQVAFQEVLRDDTPTSRQKYRTARNNYQRELRRLQNQWWLDRAHEIEGHAERHDSKNFFKAVKLLTKAAGQEITKKAGDELFSRLLLVGTNRKIQLKEMFKYNLSPVPQAISTLQGHW